MIKNLSELSQTLKTNDARNWTKQADLDTQEALGGLEAGTATGKTQTFGDFLRESIAKVNGMQEDANVAMQKLASGESQDLHETLLAVEKAEIAFKTMNQVRSKVIDAYREIMRMQV